LCPRSAASCLRGIPRFLREIQRRFLIVDAGTLIEHKGRSTVGALSLQPTRECDRQQDGSSCGKQQPSCSNVSKHAAFQLRVHVSACHRALCIGEKLLMRGACGASVETEIVTARRIKPLMPEELFDVSDRTTVKEECRGHGVAENMRAHRLREACSPAIDCERVFDSILLQEAMRESSQGHKERLIIIPPPRQVPIQPQEPTVEMNFWMWLS
jgi:hypothetical protein